VSEKSLHKAADLWLNCVKEFARYTISPLPGQVAEVPSVMVPMISIALQAIQAATGEDWAAQSMGAKSGVNTAGYNGDDMPVLDGEVLDMPILPMNTGG
jgi:hypothetical protein